MTDPYTARLFQIESGGNPNATTGSNRGLGQFGPAEEAQFGLNDQNRTDPNAQAAAVQREAALHSGVLSKALGRDPTPGEMYLTHQQGIAGGPALLTADPSQPAWQVIRPFYKSDAIAQKAITGNIPGNDPLARASAGDITAGDFRNMWVNKFERGMPQGSAPQQTASAQPNPVAPAPAAAAPGAPPDAGGPSLPAPGTPSPGGMSAPSGPPLGMLAGQMPTDPNAGQPQTDPALQMLQQHAAAMMQQQPEQPPPLAPIQMPQPRSMLAARLRAAAMGRGFTGGA